MISDPRGYAPLKESRRPAPNAAGNSAHAILRTENVAAGYGAHVVVDDVELAIPAGTVCTLVGPNGAGKSTLLKTITRQLEPLGGTLYLNGRDLLAMDPNEVARSMAILTTERVKAELMTTYDIVAMGRYPHTGRLGLLREADRQAIASALQTVGIREFAENRFSTLSDGQKQRVMLARALCQEPRFLVLDEPTSYMDIRHKLAFVRMARRLAHEQNLAILMSLHELELAQHVSDVVVCVAHGHIDRTGTPTEVFANGYIRRLYDVDDESFDEIYPGLDGRVQSPRPALDHYVRSGKNRLRCGITTGTCAALATAGATRLLLSGMAPEELSLVTPKGLPVEVEPTFAEMRGEGAVCGVRKDAGDDPDVTDGIVVVSTVAKTENNGICIDGGGGVGRVTKPGLDQPVGAAAINSVPRRMIEEQARSVAKAFAYDGGLAITISVPGGADVARQTFNPNLGVVDGISILGTSGIEEPMSESALVQSIELELSQARATGYERVVLVPGNYAEAFICDSMRGLADTPQVKFSNYLGDALDAAAELGFTDVLVVGHIGKLVKLAGGIMNTHSRVADCRLELLCCHAALCGADATLCASLMQAATTDAALDLLHAAGLKDAVVASLLKSMQGHLDRRANEAMRVGAVVFSNQYGLLGITSVAQKIIAAWEVSL